MLVETIVAALVIGCLSGRKITNLRGIALKGVPLLLIAVGSQLGIYSLFRSGVALSFSPVIHSVSYFLLLLFVLFNIRLPGMPFLAAGVFLNGLVISLNHGVMPVDPAFLSPTARDALLATNGTHGLLTATTRLSFLADRFFVAIPLTGKQLFSFGDVLIDLGVFILVLTGMGHASGKIGQKWWRRKLLS